MDVIGSASYVAVEVAVLEGVGKYKVYIQALLLTRYLHNRPDRWHVLPQFLDGLSIQAEDLSNTDQN